MAQMYSDDESKKFAEGVLHDIEQETRAPYEDEHRLSEERRRRELGRAFTPSSAPRGLERHGACGGTGKLKCEQCDGRGEFYDRRTGIRERCPVCYGTGYVKCQPCNGTGYW